MSFSIQTNVNSLIAQENLRVNSNFQGQTIQRLTSGYRINQSGDDAAGLAIANKLRSDTAELMQGVRNANDGISQLQIIDGGMNNVSKMLDRLRTLATQSASGTFTGDRKVLNSEFQSLISEIDRQAQSIGLNTGGAFAKNLDVYIGSGSGSQSQTNGVVTLDLTKSMVDAQSLGLKGMEAVNLTSGQLGSTNAGTDIGPSAGLRSVENIIKAATGNAMATPGHALFQFSGTGFSDTGKISVSVNLAGVTDVSTLAAAVNTAIQNSGNGSTAAATAFKNANIVASVHTDTSGGQELAFSSSSSAFQVQAGDQMANAMLGNLNGSGVGTAVNTTTVTGANTSVGAGFAQNQVVKLVITGGGLASPVTMSVGTGGGAVTTSNAIADLETQFSGNAQLQAAGLTMSGSTTPGTPLSFVSTTGQTFTVQTSGDTSNLLGLGSFLTGTAGSADYTSLSAGTAYSAVPAATGASTAAGLEISLNGGSATALTPIDLTAGAHATAASVTGSAVTLNPQGGVDITAANDKFNVTVVNNGTSTALSATLTHSTPATSGKVASGSVVAATSIVVSAGTNDSFMLALNGGVSKTVTLAAATYSGAALLTQLNTQLDTVFGAGNVVASFNGPGSTLVFTSAATGTGSSVALSAAATGDMLVGAGANKLNIASGTANSGTNDAPRTLAAIASELQTAFDGVNAGAVTVSVSNDNKLSIASTTKGANSSVTVAAIANNAYTTLGLTVAPAVTGSNSTIADVLDNLNAQFSSNATWQAADLKATNVAGAVTISSGNGTSFRLNALGAGLASAQDIGFGHGGASFAAGLTGNGVGSAMSTLQAYGISQSNVQTFTAMKFGSDSQAITFSANDTTGALETTTVTLQNTGANRSGRSIDDAVAYINQQLQQSISSPALQKIVAVKELDGGVEKINFVSALGNFTVGVASTANGGGINAGVASTVSSVANGSASSMSVDSQAGALQSVTAIAAAIGALGSAQAAVGKGQNQLNYAVNLAQSQVSNFSAAESRIRDADVAAEAANLTKAQVLQQASMAAMAQANSAPQAVMALLRG